MCVVYVFIEYKSPSATVVKSAFFIPKTDVLLCNSLYSIEILVDLPNFTVPSELRECTAKPFLCALVKHAFNVQSLLTAEIYDQNPYITENVDIESMTGRLQRGLFNFVGEVQSYLWGMN